MPDGRKLYQDIRMQTKISRKLYQNKQEVTTEIA